METIQKQKKSRTTKKRPAPVKPVIPETLKKVPFFALKTNGANPRKSFDQEEIAELAQSIKQDGILQNLVVTENDQEDCYIIITGERRFRALSLLIEKGEIEADYPVPVSIRFNQTPDDHLRLAVVENVQRKNMHPLDEADAFFALTRQGVDLESVSSQSGLSIKTIRRRLLLYNLIDDAKALYRAGSLKLSQAEAIGRANNDDQADILERIYGGWEMDAEEINDYLISDKPNIAMVKFDIRKYTGTITTDLFGEDKDSFFDDVEQFESLQDEAVDILEAEYVFNTDIAWVEVKRDYQFNKWQYDEAKEGEKGGVVILYRPDFEVSVYEGLILKVEEKAVIADDDSDTPDDETSSNAESDKVKRPPYSKKAYEYVANHKTVSVQNILALNIRKAKEIDVMQRMGLGREVRIGWHKAYGLQSEDNEHKTTGVLAMGALATELQKLLNMNWKSELRYNRDYDAMYVRLKELTDEELDKVLSILIALSFGQETFEREEPKDSLFNKIGRDLEISTRKYWKPDVEFLSLHNKGQLLEIADDTEASKGRYFDKLKKSELVFEMTNYFGKDEPLKDEKREKLRQEYCPKIMQFDE